jgi:hypothetical protein
MQARLGRPGLPLRASRPSRLTGAAGVTTTSCRAGAAPLAAAAGPPAGAAPAPGHRGPHPTAGGSAPATAPPALRRVPPSAVQQAGGSQAEQREQTATADGDREAAKDDTAAALCAGTYASHHVRSLSTLRASAAYRLPLHPRPEDALAGGGARQPVAH